MGLGNSESSNSTKGKINNTELKKLAKYTQILVKGKLRDKKNKAFLDLEEGEKAKIFYDLEEIIKKSALEIEENLEGENENTKILFADKVIQDLENYAKENNLEQNFLSVLGEHQKDVFKTILSGKEIFSGEEQIISLKDETNDYVEKVLKDTFSNAYKFKMGLSRLQGFVDKIEDKDKKEVLETLIKQTEGNSEEYLDNADSFVEYMEQVLEKNNIKRTIEIEAIISIFKEVRDYNTLAHRVRGFHEDEASKEGLIEAIKQNISELEFDIRFSKDGKAIIHHNASMGNSANRSEYIKNLEYSELKDIKLKNGGYIIDLSDFFAMVKQSGNESTIINIDIKDFGKQGLDHILDLIKEHKFDHRVKLVSWSGQDLQYMYEKRPDLHYSLSYFPETDGLIGKGLLKASESKKLIGLLSKIAKGIAVKRQDLVKGTGYEVVMHPALENADEHYSDSDLYGENLENGKAKHPMILFKEGLENNEMYRRILQSGSINIMAFDELLQGKSNFIVKFFKNKLMNKVNKKLKKRVQEMKNMGVDTNIYDVGYEDGKEKMGGIETNVYDIKNPEILNKHFEAVGPAGTIYSSGGEKTMIKMSLKSFQERIGQINEDKKFEEIVKNYPNIDRELYDSVLNILRSEDIKSLENKIVGIIKQLDHEIRYGKEKLKSNKMLLFGVKLIYSKIFINGKYEKLINKNEKKIKLQNDILNILKELI